MTGITSRQELRPQNPHRPHLRAADVAGLAASGLRGRPVRTMLSAAGVALGVATLVAVLGISSSSRAQLLAEIDALGTNLLTVTPGQSFSGQTVTLPERAPAMLRRIGPVLADSAIGDVGGNVAVYRNDRIPAANTNAIAVYTARPSLLTTLEGHLARGAFLNAATVHFPAVVLGATAATVLGIDRADGSVQLWLGDHWFSVVGILDPLPLAPDLDRAALVGSSIAEQELHAHGAPAEIFVRTYPASLPAVAAVAAATADPAAPQDVLIADPTDALVARAAANSALESLFIALGAVALLVGGVGIANVMVIAVLERRSEIGLRRALGATRAHVGLQFVTESALLAALGSAAGTLTGAFVSTAYAAARHWEVAFPPGLLAAVCAAAVTVGAVAGLYPALRASRLSPSEALRTA